MGIPDVERDLDINTDTHSEEEIIAALKGLKDRKAPRYDNQFQYRSFKNRCKTGAAIV